MNADGPLTADRILERAEEVLRRFGPGKATVVDVARALGVSHGSVYRHFPSKAALRGAVTARWLQRVSGPLAEIADGEGPATERLHRWLRALIDAKRALATDDPELFATYMTLAAEDSEAVDAHVGALVHQLTHIVSAGVRRGELASSDAAATARALFAATARFHDPVHVGASPDPAIDEQFEDVWDLLLGGLRARR